VPHCKGSISPKTHLSTGFDPGEIRLHPVMNNKDYSFVENISERTGISKTRYINMLISEARKKDGLK